MNRIALIGFFTAFSFLAGAAQDTAPPAAVTRAPDPGRVERLRESLRIKELVPGVHRGWEGDPRKPTWVTLCDDGSNANACWLVGIQLTPALSLHQNRANPRFRDDPAIMGDDPDKWESAAGPMAVAYLKKGCDLLAAEACADLGDYYRFRGKAVVKTGFGKPYRSFDLKQAFNWYKVACDLASAYGCYALAEFTDRGIATPRNPGLARAHFQELCESGLAVACLRQNAPAPAYRYKVFSRVDSECSDSGACWTECKGGAWGACLRVDGATLANLPPKEVSAAKQRACAEGADWGCDLYPIHFLTCSRYLEGSCSGGSGSRKPPSVTKPVKTALVNGCNAGSESACYRACVMLPEVEAELACSTRWRSPFYFPDKSVQQRMQECFGGSERGCFDFLRTEWYLPATMTPEESKAYRASALIFFRMGCNAGWDCRELVAYYGNSQLGWAYRTSDHVSKDSSAPFFQSFTPMEKALAARWLMNARASEIPLPPDVVSGLDEMCTGGIARTCRALADHFFGKSVRTSVDPSRQAAVQGLLEDLKALENSSPRDLSNCYYVPTGTVGTVEVVETAEGRACMDRNERNYRERKASLWSEMDRLRLQPSSTTSNDPVLWGMGLDYLAKACRAGDRIACVQKPGH
jgi:TPR repeat protein